MTIKQLCRNAHRIAVEKGFWGNPELKAQRNLSELLMLIVSELGEACEALRKSHRQISRKDYDNLKSVEVSPGVHCGFKFARWTKDTFEDELADAVIRIADLAESEGIDLEWQIQKKLEYNKTRPQMHGKKF